LLDGAAALRAIATDIRAAAFAAKLGFSIAR
jgi:hypothetical protein